MGKLRIQDIALATSDPARTKVKITVFGARIPIPERSRPSWKIWGGCRIRILKKKKKRWGDINGHKSLLLGSHIVWL